MPHESYSDLEQQPDNLNLATLALRKRVKRLIVRHGRPLAGMDVDKAHLKLSEPLGSFTHVSIARPHYNPNFLLACLQSDLNQKFGFQSRSYTSAAPNELVTVHTDVLDAETTMAAHPGNPQHFAEVHKERFERERRAKQLGLNDIPATLQEILQLHDYMQDATPMDR